MDMWKTSGDCMCIDYNRGLIRVCKREVVGNEFV